MDSYKVTYYKNICDIKDDFINEKISKKEYEQKLENERQKYIEVLIEENRFLMEQMKREFEFEQYLKTLTKQEPIGYQGLTLEQRINEFLKKC